MVARKPKKTLFCYCHVGGDFVVGADKSVAYNGGRVDGIVIDQDITIDTLNGLISDRLHIPPSGNVLKYSVKFDKSCLLPLEDQSGLTNLLQFNDDVAFVYVERVGTAPPPPAADPVPATRHIDVENQIAADNGAGVDYNETNVDFSLGCGSREESSLDVEYTDMDPFEHTSTDREPELQSAEVPNPIPLMPGEWGREIIGVGQEFPSRLAFKQALYKYSLAHSFRYIHLCNKVRLLRMKCIVKTCPWRVTARPTKRKGYNSANPPVVITNFTDRHEHSEEEDQMKPEIKPKIIADIIRERMRSTPDVRPGQVAEEIASEFALTLTYEQSFRVRKRAEETASWKLNDTYKLIPWMCEHLKTMIPGTVATWEATEDYRLKQLFIAYPCSVQGFQSGCRPLLVVNHNEVSNPYKGTLVSASALDANDTIYPLAYGICASKDNNDWTWFFEKLKSLVGEVVIISDYDKNMLKTVNGIFGVENHALCYWHIRESFKTSGPEELLGSRLESALSFLDGIAYGRSGAEYGRNLLAIHQYSKELYDWVLAKGPEHWANSQFGKKRWDIFYSDPADSFVSWMHTESQVQVFDFMRAHQGKLKELLLSRQSDAASWKLPVGPKIEKKIKENCRRGQGLVMKQVSDSIFEFPSQRTYILDFSIRSCSCLEWQMTGIPCPHACRVLQWGNLNIYSYVDKYYHKETQESIYAALMPSLPPNGMPKPCQIANVGSKPVYLRPPNTLKVGRHRGMRGQCSLCDGYGHNRKSCKNA